MKKLIILIIIICASILAGILIPKKSIYFIFENTGYYFIFVSFFLWVDLSVQITLCTVKIPDPQTL